MDKLNIAMVSSELAPLAKTGGLADVLSALPSQLLKRGHQCCVFLPAYKSAIAKSEQIEDLHLGFPVPLGDTQIAARVLKTRMADSGLTVYLIDQPRYFDRDQLYGDVHGDFQDNCARFTFFNRAVLEAIRRLRLPINVIHCHDWQAGLIPAYLKTGTETLDNSPMVATVMTIHNLAYQGRYWAPDFAMTGLPYEVFNAAGIEFYSDLCFLKSGLIFADELTTVSSNYAKEIQRPEFGCALDGVLRSRSDQLHGIVNGVDYSAWNPATDQNLPENYSVDNWAAGKAKCKAALQEELDLPIDPNIPIIGMVGRLATQKGWDITIPVMERWLSHANVQWVVLGSGEARYQDWLTSLRARFSDRLSLQLKFSEPLAHRIEAGSDLFLMPSQYEPCGLNQLYSLLYGTVPVVHAVGGLVDTVSPMNLNSSNEFATGFAFHEYNSDALDNCLTWAMQTHQEEPEAWTRLVTNGMKQDWSWDASAAVYENVYRSAISRRINEIK